MKKLLALLIAILMFACCGIGCEGQKEPEVPDEKPPASTIIPPIQNGGDYDGGEYD